MITQLPIGHAVAVKGFVFTLNPVYISVHNLDGELMAMWCVLNEEGHRIVRTEEDFHTEIDFWLRDNL